MRPTISADLEPSSARAHTANASAPRPQHLAIVGPTACGKSALALEIARRSGDAEIVSLDSMQVYRGMDIGTAKATIGERAEVPHHLIDVVDCSGEWTVAHAQAEARAAIAAIEQRGRRAILVGGTGLYVQAVMDDLTLPGEDLVLRAELEAMTSEPGGLLAAWRELQAADPVAASRIDEHNQRRIVRALEVIRSTGKPFSSFGGGVFDAPPAVDALRIGLWWPRSVLAQRIEQRFEHMRSAGLVDEVRAIAAQMSRSARQAIGYKELLTALDESVPQPDNALDEAFDLAVRRTRSFARRQRMWFRRDPRIIWCRGVPGEKPDEKPDEKAETSPAEKPIALATAVLACWRGTS